MTSVRKEFAVIYSSHKRRMINSTISKLKLFYSLMNGLSFLFVKRQQRKRKENPGAGINISSI